MKKKKRLRALASFPHRESEKLINAREELELIKIEKERKSLLADDIEKERIAKKREQERLQREDTMDELIVFSTNYLYDLLSTIQREKGLPYRPLQIALLAELQATVIETFKDELSSNISDHKERIQVIALHLVTGFIKGELLKSVDRYLSQMNCRVSIKNKVKGRLNYP